jgi:NDP-sugar pyrophosphorylase family protein
MLQEIIPFNHTNLFVWRQAMYRSDDFFDFSQLGSPLAELFDSVEWVWDVLKKLNTYLEDFLLDKAAILGEVEDGATLVNRDQIYIGPGTRIEAGAYITGPAYIGANCQVRHGAYIRGSVMAGENCVLGHASEFKNALLFPESHAAHFSYVGDSILGHRVNLGAGTKLANMEMFSDYYKLKTGQRPTLKILLPGIDEPIDTGLTKLGAIIGDDVQTGCNTVTNPGCLIGRNTLIYANTSLLKGYYEPNKIIKLRQGFEVADWDKSIK